VTVEVNAVPVTPAVTVTGGAAAATFCAGGNAVLNSSSATGNQWYKDGIIITGATNQTYTVTQSGNYTVKTTTNSCASNASAASVVTVNVIPAQPAITQVGNALQSSAASGNQWLLNGAAIASATGQTYSPTTSGMYTVQVTTNGCTGIASPGFNFTITAVSDPVLDKKITMAPNPVSNDLLIKYNGNGAKFSVMLYNINGAVLNKGTFTSTYQLDMRKYSAGLYIIRIVNERNGEKVQRMIVKQ
jgi:Secretion system C-terminal sorting domain